MKKISIFVATSLLSSTFAFANSTSFEEAFANGKTTGGISLFYQGQDNNGENKDSASLVGILGLNYETDSVYGFTGSIGAVANHKFSENENGNYREQYQNKALINNLNIKYTNENFFASIGRQEILLEWMGYFYESIVTGTTIIPNTTIVAGFASRASEVALDVIEDFTDRGAKDGVYVLDAKTSIGIEGLELNPYYYAAPDVANFYGLKTSYNNNIWGITAHLAVSSLDSSFQNSIDENGERIGGEDGNIINLEARLNMIENLSLALGYITTNSGGAEIMTRYGDNLSPFEDGNNTYTTNADTLYLSAGYDLNFGLGVFALYGQTDYKNAGVKADEKELNIGAGYNITDSLSTEILYVKYSGNSSDEDYDKILAGISYSF